MNKIIVTKIFYAIQFEVNNSIKINKFVKENDWEICEPVCDSELVASVINCHEVSISCHHITRGHVLR
jgi:hypothetical protein